MSVATKLRPFGHLMVGQIVDYVGTPTTNARRYQLSSRRWHVVHVQPQQETRVEQALEAASFAAYLPREAIKVRMVRERYRKVFRPMLPGWLFAGFDPVGEPWQEIGSIRGVLRVLMWDGRPVPIAELEMACVRAAEERARGYWVDRRLPPTIKVGDCVQLKEGPFIGFFGFVTKVWRAECWMLETDLDIFGRQTQVRIPCDQVEQRLDVTHVERLMGNQYKRPRSPC